MKTALRRPLAVAVLGVLAIGVLAGAAPSPIRLVTVLAAGGPWLDRFNAWRASAAVSTLTENPAWSQGDLNHSTYMVKNNLITHYETVGNTWYTVSGDAAGQNGNIFVSSTTATQDVQAIDWWMQAPVHAMGMMDPRLAQTGFGSYREAIGTWQMGASLDVLRGNPFTGGSYPVYFPGNGSTEPLKTYGGFESPDPLQGNCAGYTTPTGLPVFVEIGGNVATTAGPVHTFTGNGVPLEHCVLDSNSPNVGPNLTYRGGVVLIPKQPLQTGVTYVVTLTVNGLPYTWSFNVGPLAPASTLPPVAAVFPAMTNGAYGGYVTAATIQNIGSAPALVRIAYFNQNGASVGAGDVVTSLPVNASWTVRQDNGNSFGAGGAGSAIVYSSQPIASFVNEFAPGSVGDATSYTGVPVPTGVGTTLYAPTIVNNAYGAYTTGIGLLNQGSSPTDVTFTYRDAGGTVVRTQTVTGLAAHAYQAVYSGDAILNLPNGFIGTASITSTGGQLVGAIVNETGPGGQFSSYTAVPVGGASLNAPVALNNAYAGYTTGMAIQNTSAISGAVTVTYYDAAGAPTVKTFNIAPFGYRGVYQGSATDGPAPGAYTAVIQSSTVQLAAIVNEVAPPGVGTARQSTSYNTFSAGIATLRLPLVENAGSDPWNTGLGIMNTGSSSTTVQVNYYDAATGAATGTPQTQTLAPHAFWGLYQPPGGLPAGTRATAVITASAGGQVAVICNESSTTTFMSYGAQ